MAKEMSMMAPTAIPRIEGNVLSKINGFERSHENDANLVIFTDNFSYTGYSGIGYDFRSVVRSFTAERILIRDKSGIIESNIRKDQRIKFSADEYDLEDGMVDLTGQNTNITFESKDGAEIAQTKLLTISLSGQQKYIEFPGVPTIVTVGKTVDCMPGNKKVCHPELHLESVINNKRTNSTLKRGEKIDIDAPGVKSIYLTDAHTYDQYKHDHFSDYLRAEFLMVFEDGFTSENIEKSQLSNKVPLADRYCTISFNKSLDDFNKSCGIRARINNVFTWFTALFVEEDDGYIVC